MENGLILEYLEGKSGPEDGRGIGANDSKGERLHCSIGNQERYLFLLPKTGERMEETWQGGDEVTVCVVIR